MLRRRSLLIGGKHNPALPYLRRAFAPVTSFTRVAASINVRAAAAISRRAKPVVSQAIVLCGGPCDRESAAVSNAPGYLLRSLRERLLCGTQLRPHGASRIGHRMNIEVVVLRALEERIQEG